MLLLLEFGLARPSARGWPVGRGSRPQGCAVGRAQARRARSRHGLLPALGWAAPRPCLAGQLARV